MIAPMFRKFAALLVVLGWVSLSCFDVVEDLDEIPGQPALSSSSPDSSSTSLQFGWVRLANNIVESAPKTDQAGVILTGFLPIAFAFNRLVNLRRTFQLHKLYRVFLI
jgi:hypothetical protein